ncbi:hypothetical protein BJX99DRAFT_228181 [Aspergillus californicus]
MSMRGPMRRSHLRQVSAASLETVSTSRSVDTSQHDALSDHPSSSDGKPFGLSSTGLSRRQCSLWVHDETFSKEEILFNQAAFADTGVRDGDVIEILSSWSVGDAPHAMKSELGSRPLRDGHVKTSSTSRSKFKTPLQTRCLFVAKPLPQDTKTKHPKLELSVTSSVANIFGFKNRTTVYISIVDRAQCSASHVDVSFRDQFMVRSDMWRLVMSELAGKIIYKGQKVMFMGSIKATVKNIFIRGKKVLSGFFSPQTIPVFRSEAAKYVLFIQMSREMWDFDSEGTGDILFSRVINGFLPELFKRWASSDARHLVTIVLFTRVEYDASATGLTATLNSENLKNTFNPNHSPTRDFYRVVVNDMASGHWTTILDELKKDFRTFLRDVSILKTPSDPVTPLGGASTTPSATIAGRPSTALRGNILEAIHLASSHLAFDHIDRDMVHTGTSIIVITPGSGVFEVSYESLASTTEALTNRGIAIDLVCLSPMPLHSVPLFKYREPAQRRSSSTYGEIQNGGYSPEMRHSFPSLTSRTHFSSKSTISSTPPGNGLRGPWARPHDWSYGIPHWLDISYWNPETYRESRRILKKDPNAPITFTVTKKSKIFKPRVRMYEIQMGGVMESEQSNISVPYLLEGQGVPRGIGAASMAPSASSLRHSSPFNHQLSDSLRPSSFLQGMAKPRDMSLSKSQKASSTVAWMDNYDDQVFRPLSGRHHHRKPSKSKRTSEPDVQVSSTHDRLSARSITHLREHETNPTERHPAVRRFEATPKNKTLPPRKPALKAASTSKSPRISRTISFALRGLGVAPPRAQASTEVNVEHATGMPTMNRKKSKGTLRESKSIESLSASDSASTATVIEASPTPNTPPLTPKSPTITPSRPISIKVPMKPPSEDQEQQAHSVIPESFSTAGNEHPIKDKVYLERQARRSTPRFELTVSPGSREPLADNSQNRLLAPWVRSVNPCNTPREVSRDTSWFGRWQHAYPRPPHVAVVKWKSLKSPAILPLTTEEFPLAVELASDYLQTPYRVFPNDDAEGIDAPKTTGSLLREMISLRLSHGFQIVVGNNVVEASGRHTLKSPNVFDTQNLERDGTTVFLSKGHSIHRLVCTGGCEIEVTRFLHRSLSHLTSEKKNGLEPVYSPAMRTILSPEYELKHIKHRSSAEDYNWNYADNYVAGHRDYLLNPAQQLHFWRVRYVLIPMRLHVHSRRHMQPFNEDNEEEIHLLGINQLTHIWQRHKYVPPEEKRIETSTRKSEENPLNIMYQTRNPSDVVAAEHRLLLADPGLDSSAAQLLPESELLERSNISISSLAHIVQGDKGVRMMDRRWHWRLHYNCFIGFEFTTWLTQSFRDIDSREEAVEFGEELRKHGLFQHVEKRHNFRDGNYFYQISSEYRVARPESRNSWFPQIRPDKSIPSMPSTPGTGDTWKDSPLSPHSRSASLDQSAPVTPSTPLKSKNKAAIMLSKTLKYDVDPRKRSNRPEIIDLHYDRLHNPDNCFHIELSWMNTTPKLIEDTVQSWAATAEKFGLKLVQVPIAEASAIDQTQPFRQPYRVKLKVPPPKGPKSTVFSTASFQQQDAPDPHYFQKLILQKFDFVLDFEAWSAFPPDVEVSYSWGRPDYRYSQYIHQSGSVLAQITDEGDFLLLANRLVSTRTVASNRDIPRHDRLDRSEQYRARAGTYDPIDRLSPRLSPLVRPIHDIAGSPSPQSQSSFDAANLYRAPEHILNGFEEFCNDPVRLGHMYNDSFIHTPTAKAAPTTASFIDSSIPSLELPAPVIDHHISPPPDSPSRPATGVGNLPLINPRSRQRDDSMLTRGGPRSGGLRPLNLSGA